MPCLLHLFETLLYNLIRAGHEGDKTAPPGIDEHRQGDKGFLSEGRNRLLSNDGAQVFSAIK
jgi:hypothetical protein